MPTKTRPYGTHRLTVPNTIWSHTRANGTKTQNVAAPSVSAYDRRMGTQSTVSDQTGRDGRFRPVVHTSVQYTGKPLGSLQNWQGYVQPGGGSTIVKTIVENSLFGVHAVRYPLFLAGVAGVNNTFNALVDWNSLAADAVQAMLPSFHTQNSLINFILELKDFRSVVKLVSSNFGRKLDRLNTFITRDPITGLRRARNVNFDRGKPFSWLAKRHLEYQFGWRPLFNDVVSLVKEISGFSARYNEIVVNANRPVQKHWSRTLTSTALAERVSYSDLSGTTPNGTSYGPFLSRVRCQVVREPTSGIQYNATLRMRYALPKELSAVGGQAKAWLDLLGVSRNPAVLWNAIPFSFLVDYVVNVGKYLDRLRLDNIEFKTEISDFCHSAKFERRVRLDLSGNNQLVYPNNVFGAWIETDSAVVKRYERRTGLPDFRLAMQTSGLNPREVSLVGALVGAKRSH